MPSSKPSKKQRLDVLLVERGMAETRARAQALILAGKVFVGGKRSEKAGAQVAADAAIELVGEAQRYVSRGGQKLEGALEECGVSAAGKICIDVGSSTGGFTDCLLQHGAARVYAVDVTVGQMAWKLQRDARVVRIERNARNLKPADIPEPAALVTVDVSFISAVKILPAVTKLAVPGADFLILVKPQFELEKKDIGRGGIVRDPRLHDRAVERVAQAARECGLAILDVRPSRLAGAEGNQEFFLHARRQPLE